MFATPVGYFIDQQGVIAAEVSTGADAILSAAGERHGAAVSVWQTRERVRAHPRERRGPRPYRPCWGGKEL
jgi:hypothetical protein